jgi:rhodanese-related sulfurtransferase
MFGRILFFLTLCILVLTSSLPALAKNYQDIDAPTLKAMMDKGEALVVFPLSKIEYNNLHIRGSVNIDLENIARVANDHPLPDGQGVQESAAGGRGDAEVDHGGKAGQDQRLTDASTSQGINRGGRPGR